MRYANCRLRGSPFAAEVTENEVRPLAGQPPLGGDTDFSALAGADRGDPLPLAGVELLAPVQAPGKVICLGLNYKSHVTETERDLPTYPVLFTKFADCLVGPGEAIVAPPESSHIDYEAELAVIVGRTARRVPPDEALGAVAGYTVANDVTMRDYQYKSHQWLQGKAWPRSTPLGPWLVTGDEIDHARALDIRLELNGREMQSSNTRLMIFDVATTLSLLSTFTTLEPGDVVLMGTPGGVGFRRDPKVRLAPGDRVKVEIAGIGAIENEVVAEDVG